MAKDRVSGLQPEMFFDLVSLGRWRAEALCEQSAYAFIHYSHDESRHLTTLSYADVDRTARVIAGYLQRNKPSGKRAILIFPPGIEYIAAFYGCLYAGAWAVPVYPPLSHRDSERIRPIIIDATPDFILTCDLFEQQARQLAADSSLHTRVVNIQHIPADCADNWITPDTDAESIAFLQYTSGSTGHPKGVMITHGNLLHNLGLISESFEAVPESHGVIWLPPYHDMGLIGGILTPIYSGFPVTLMSPWDFLQQPVRWLQAVSDCRADISGGPNFAYEYCVNRITPREIARLDLSSWTLAFNGAETIRSDVLKRFAKTFGVCGFRMEAFYPCYGLAESTLTVTGGKKSEPPNTITLRNESLTRHKVCAIKKTGGKGRFETTLTGCGPPLGQDLLIVDPESRLPREQGRVGEVWIRGPSVAKGYWNNTGETEKQFNAYTADNQDGPFFRTGDLGFFDHNEFFPTGRLKELIVIHGRNHYPVDVEYVVQGSCPALRKGCGAAFAVDSGTNERLVVVQEVRPVDVGSFDARQAATKVFQMVLIKNGLHVSEVVFIEPSTLPKTTSGKLCRIQCLEEYRTGALKVIGRVINRKAWLPMNVEEKTACGGMLEQLNHMPAAERKPFLLTYLRTQIAWSVGLDSFKAVPTGIPIFDLGMDSLAAVELKNRVEQDLRCRLDATIFIDYPTCEKFIDHLINSVLDLN